MARKKTPSKKPAALKAEPFKGVIFDIDNVLIDTRHSYLDAIRWTIETFLTAGKLPFFEAAPKNMRPALLSLNDVHKFKLLGGFNDDWDCCYGFLIYLLNLPVQSRTILELKKRVDLDALSKRVKTKPLRVDGIVKMLGRPSFVTVEKIGRIFQEIYLGKELFPKTEKLTPLFWKKKGLIEKEKLIIREPMLKALKQSGLKLGIATGRPGFEAHYSLKYFGILDYFDAMTTLNDVRREESARKQSVRKPHPFSVVETARLMGLKNGLIYVGDLPDDVLAANRAKETIGIQSVAFLAVSGSDKASMRELEKEKPDYILKTPADLKKLLTR